MDIQWYPGHMAKTKRILQENLALIDIIIEIIDARIPFSSKNPDIKDLAPSKSKILLLNKCDLADEKITRQYIETYKKQNYDMCLEINSITGKNFDKINQAINTLSLRKKESLLKRGRVFSPTRLMVVGIPNVGKSTFTNKFVGKKIAKVGNKPGITQSKQWIKLRKDVELLDTPGILWPKFENQQVGLNLAITGAIKDTNLNTYQIALELINYLNRFDKNILQERYKIEYDKPDKQINSIAVKRCFIKKSNEPDLERTAKVILDEFRSGKLGKISLDRNLLSSL